MTQEYFIIIDGKKHRRCSICLKVFPCETYYTMTCPDCHANARKGKRGKPAPVTVRDNNFPLLADNLARHREAAWLFR
jgi:Zn finger protein HypA/HybF involved in hydrogenase expression